ncbi:MAG: DNA primase [Patescibacteria group bacterium]|jgi:DNA primase
MPQSTTEEIKSKLNILDVIKEYIEVKPAGAYHKARCPFHNEKTPSFMVSPDRQIYHCFGCGEHGDVFTFVQKMEGLDFPDALRLLAKKAGVEIRAEDPRIRNERTKLSDIVRFASRVYQEQLRRLPENHPVKEYLKQRSITSEVIETFQIGFAPDSWDSLFEALKKKNVRQEDALAAGLLVRKDDGNGFYDRFRARLMFPIADVHGTIVGFGGRVIPTLEARCLGKEAAKYINTPQSPIYNKSGILYGLHLAKNAIRTKKKVVVVEGYMDCIAAHRCGTEHVVASSGTAFTEGQAKLLKRFTDTVLVAYDMDEAGIAASARGVSVLLREGMTVRVVSLPDKKDPDDVIRENPDVWKEAIEKPKLFVDFAFDQTLKNRDLGNVEDKKAVAGVLMPLIANLGNDIEQTHYLQKLSASVQVDESVLRNALHAVKETAPHARRNSSDTEKKKSFENSPELELLSVLMKKPSFYEHVHDKLILDAITNSDLRVLYTLMQNQYNESHELNIESLRTKIFEDTSTQGLVTYLDIAELGSARLPEHTDNMGMQLVNAMMSDYHRAVLKRLAPQIHNAEQSGDKQKMAGLMSEHDIHTRELQKFTSNM